MNPRLLRVPSVFVKSRLCGIVAFLDGFDCNSGGIFHFVFLVLKIRRAKERRPGGRAGSHQAGKKENQRQHGYTMEYKRRRLFRHDQTGFFFFFYMGGWVPRPRPRMLSISISISISVLNNSKTIPVHVQYLHIYTYIHYTGGGWLRPCAVALACCYARQELINNDSIPDCTPDSAFFHAALYVH